MNRRTEEPFDFETGPQILRVFETHPLMRRTRVVDFVWHGPVNVPVRISDEFLRYDAGLDFAGQFPERLSCFPWPLRKVDDDNWAGFYAIYVRTDVGRFNWLYYAALARARRIWRWLFARLVWTLVVWGLAYVERGTFPTWGDVLKPQRESAAWKRWRARFGEWLR
jgi:hypothetical protein